MNILQQRIQEASQKYYSDGNSGVSDAEFDSMLEQLKKEDPNSPLLGVGHGYDINKNSTSGARVKHKYGQAGSLDKCHNLEEIPAPFITDDLHHASVKLDGLSMVLYYKDGVLYQALTRGGGQAGIDKTYKIRIILQGSNKLADATFTGAVRGEVVMSYGNFETYKKLHPEAKNPRNSAAGIINSNEIIPEELQLLDVVVYTVVGVEPKLPLPQGAYRFTYADIWEWLSTNFVHVAKHTYITLNRDTFMADMETLQKRWYGTYPADGIVIAKNDLKTNESKDGEKIEVIYQALAFKFKAESKITKVIGTEWNLTKTKYLVPRVNVETVELSGTNVSWATGFNAQNMVDQQLGVGAEVSIMKSGEIIPYIDEVINPVPCELPTTCPVCGALLVWNGVHLQCPNMECADADVQDTLVWMKHIAPRDGLGDTLKLSFLGEMFGDEISIESIYDYGPFSREELNVASVQKKNFREMFNALFSNKISLSAALQALNIPRIGDVTSRNIAGHPALVKELVDMAIVGVEDDIPDYSSYFGNANFASISANYHKFKRLAFIYDNITWIPEEVNECKGKVAITGKLSVKRSAFEEELRKNGFIPGSISKNTNYLITDDPNSSTDKNKKADEWGITKITEEEFREKFMS